MNENAKSAADQLTWKPESDEDEKGGGGDKNDPFSGIGKAIGEFMKRKGKSGAGNTGAAFGSGSGGLNTSAGTWV